ncbi:hypothetical protein VTK26DRAFT_4166 [Humicola hyalothermophila]
MIEILFSALKFTLLFSFLGTSGLRIVTLSDPRGSLVQARRITVMDGFILFLMWTFAVDRDVYSLDTSLSLLSALLMGGRRGDICK